MASFSLSLSFQTIKLIAGIQNKIPHCVITSAVLAGCTAIVLVIIASGCQCENWWIK